MTKPRMATIRRAVLCTLALQNACQMLSMRYSRLPSQPAYLSSTAVVSAEVVKIVLSFAMLVAQLVEERAWWHLGLLGAKGGVEEDAPPRRLVRAAAMDQAGVDDVGVARLT